MSEGTLATTEQQSAVAGSESRALAEIKAQHVHNWSIAAIYSRSSMVPQHLQGKTGDCFILCELAKRLGLEPFEVMQNVAVVHGRPCFEAKMLIGLVVASGRIKGTVGYIFSGDGDDYGCQAWVIDAQTNEKVIGPKVDWKMVKSEGWNKDKQLRNGGGTQKSKWNTMPDLMFRYRAAAFLIRTSYPDSMLGLHMREEIADIIDVESTPSPATVGGSNLNAALGLGGPREPVEMQEPGTGDVGQPADGDTEDPAEPEDASERDENGDYKF